MRIRGFEEVYNGPTYGVARGYYDAKDSPMAKSFGTHGVSMSAGGNGSPMVLGFSSLSAPAGAQKFDGAFLTSSLQWDGEHR